jgi:2-C-methyl-D-erythritol 4-phosphate cytidylyltransferase
MDINKLIGNVEEHPVGGFLAAPINETLKLVTSDNKVTKTVDRNQYRIAQTPQMFRAGMLQEAIQSMIENQLEPTDEASAIEYIGKQAMVINGRQDNIKITRREDLMIAEAILQDQEKQGCV